MEAFLRSGEVAVLYHGFLVGGARDGHATAATFSLLGELHVNPPVVLGHQAVVEVIVLDLQEDGLAVHEVPRLQEVDRHGGDEDAVGVDGLHGDEAGEDKHSQLSTPSGSKVTGVLTGDPQLRVDVVGEVEELLLAVGLSCGVARKEPLRSFTAARLPEPLHAQPDDNSGETRDQQHKKLPESPEGRQRGRPGTQTGSGICWFPACVYRLRNWPHY